MSFGYAIRLAHINCFNFKGRASLSEFWYYILFSLLGTIATGLFDYFVIYKTTGFQYGTFYCFRVAIFIPNIAVTTRRLQDAGISGWWQLIGWATGIGFLVLLWWLLGPSKGPNKWGDPPHPRGDERLSP